MCTAESVQYSVQGIYILDDQSLVWHASSFYSDTGQLHWGCSIITVSSSFTSHTEDLDTTSVRNSSTNWRLFIFQLYKLKVSNGRSLQSSTGFAWLIELLRNITIILAGWSSQLYIEKLILTTFVPHKVSILIFIESHSVFTCSAGFSL